MPNGKHKPIPDARRRMIAETSAFLSWALGPDVPEVLRPPRIPRRRVDGGGFSEILSRPGARQLANRWWQRVFDRGP